MVKIDGMTCDGCAATIQAGLSSTPGVLSVVVDVESGVGRIGVDPAITTVDAVADAITGLGYPASPLVVSGALD